MENTRDIDEPSSEGNNDNMFGAFYAQQFDLLSQRHAPTYVLIFLPNFIAVCVNLYIVFNFNGILMFLIIVNYRNIENSIRISVTGLR